MPAAISLILWLADTPITLPPRRMRSQPAAADMRARLSIFID